MASMKQIAQDYPWLAEPVEYLLAAQTQDRFPHALLFSGMAGLGKAYLAESLAAYLNPHPLDTTWVRPEEASISIKVDQIRALQQVINQTSLYGGKKIAIIQLAEQMNVAASNALLKILEEPPGDSLVLLLTENLSLLLPTIVSRCQRWVFSAPCPEIAKAWLCAQGQTLARIETAMTLSLGAPLKALSLLHENQDQLFETFRQDIMAYFSGQKTVVDVSKAWEKYPLASLVHYLQLILFSLIRQGESTHDFYAMYERALSAKRAVQAGVAVNTAFTVEGILLAPSASMCL